MVLNLDPNQDQQERPAITDVTFIDLLHHLYAM